MKKTKIAIRYLFPLLCSIAIILILYRPSEAMGSKQAIVSLEERVAQLEILLEQKTAEYDLEIARAQAAIEILSVMGRYSFYYTAKRFDLINDLWSFRDDASFDIGLGASIVNKVADPSKRGGGDLRQGLFRIHALTSPVIAVAADCQTARATWISPGINTELNTDGTVKSEWVWIKYGVDFIKEEGEWRFWHVTAYGLFEADFYKAWGEAEPKPLRRDLPEEITERPDYMPTDRDDWTFAKDRNPVLEPVPPLPYDTWDEVEPGYRTW